MRAAIPFHGGELEARLSGEIWIVRLGDLEARSKWLDFALSRLLDDDTQKAHELAAKLEEQLLPDQEAPTRSGK
ncbi:MAG TPA: hypothetical protein VIK66_15005 [Gaiellaceae bacterium]